jgi:SOS-response transcriptional repressor LexA
MDNRARRLRLLINERFSGHQVDLARAINRSPNVVWQYLSGHRVIGEKFARHVESCLGLPRGWLDDAHSAGPPPGRRIPVIDFIQAGRFAETIDSCSPGGGLEEIAADPELARELGPNAFALVVRGLSMTPEFQPGDLVVVDPGVPVRPGDIVVAKLQNEDSATLKKYRDRGRSPAGDPVIELVPTNDDYPVLVLTADNPGRIVGPVIEHRRRLRNPRR